MIIYVGKSILRTENEPEYDKSRHGSYEGYERIHPEARPHVFVQYKDNVDLVEALTTPSLNAKGSSGIVVQYQKETRENNTPNEVAAWRESFQDFEIPWDEVHFAKGRAEDIHHDIEDLDDDFVVLNAHDASLNVPKQVADIRAELREMFDEAGMDPSQVDNLDDAQLRMFYDNLA